MARRQGGPIQIELGGGFSTDLGTAYAKGPGGDGTLVVPFLTAAENLRFNLTGWFWKIGGSTRLNATAITETAVAQTVQGFTDYWKQGTASSESQDRVAVAGTKYLKEDVDGVWDDIATGKESGKHPAFEVFKDDLIISTTSNTDVPVVWDQATLANLGGTPPNFAFSRAHKNRLFAAGVATNPSRLYFSEHLNHEDWVGAGAGSIDIDPDDGDRITGIASTRYGLFIFKGPHKLSIHVLKGSSPTGDDPFTREPFKTGVGAVGHNSIIPVSTPLAGEDLAFLSPIGVHSLAATEKFGDFAEAFLSAPIQTYYTEQLNLSTLGTVWGVNYAEARALVWAVSAAGVSAKTKYLVYFYGFTPGRWAIWTGYVPAHSLAILEASTRKRLYAGMTTGFVEQLDTATRTTAAGGSYLGRATTPFLAFGSLGSLKSIGQGYLGLVPKGTQTLDVSVTYDSGATTTEAIDQSGNGSLWDTMLWDTDNWAGSNRIVKPVPFAGEFREAALEFRQGTTAGDMEPQALELHIVPGATSEETL